jgi:hypothetical protein
VQIRRGQKALDIARLSDSIFVKIRMAVLDTLSVSDSANYLLSRLQQSVGDIISVTDLVDYLIHEYIRRNVTDSLSVSEAVNFVLSSIQQISAAATDDLTLSELLKALRKDFAPRDTLSLSESVAYQLRSPQPANYIIPDNYAVYNHYWQTISANLSVWWDNDTSTSYSVYIRVYFFGELISSTSLVPNQIGWFTVSLPAGVGSYFDEMEIVTDSSILGFIGIAEFHIKQS